MPEKKTSILLGYECNQNCKFCYCRHKRDNDYGSLGTEAVKQKLDEGRERGSTFVDFLGGEPTIRNDIIELVKYADDVGYETISLTTNGKIMSYEQFAEKIIDVGLNHMIFSLHGHKAELHDYLVQFEGAFEKLKQGVQNAVEYGGDDFYICINTVILQQNLDTLHRIPETANGFVDQQIDAIEFIFPHPKGNAWNNFEEMVPKLENVADPIDKAIKHAEMEDFDHIVGRYIPYCYMLGNEKYVSETVAKEQGLQEEHVGPEFQNLNVEKGREEVGKVKGEQCKACKYYNKCEGIWKEYAQKRGTEELTPVP
ncbi:MAG: radical SAM protein [Candidatus Nanohaloarchaea archaeon]